MTRNKIILGLLASSALAGCSVDSKVIGNHQATLKSAESGVARAAAPASPADTSLIKVRNDVFVGGTALRIENGLPLPARFEKDNGITLVRTGSSSLREIATSITEITKIPVIVTVPSPAGQTAGAASQDATAPASGPTMANGPVPEGFPLEQALNSLRSNPGGAGGVITAPGASEASLPLSYSGRLSGLLDIVATHYNLAWRYDGNRVVLDRIITRSFDVPALPIIANLTFDLTSKSESNAQDGTSTSSGQAAKTESKVDVWADMQSALKALVGSGTTSVNTTTGVITVTADPATVARVANYLKGMNDRLGKQIAISVKVYSVALNDSEEFDLDVAGIFTKPGKNGFNLGNMPASGGVVPSVGGASGGGLGWALLDTSSKFFGSQALVNALSERGEVSVVTTASVTTVNGVPVPLQVGSLRDYVKKVTTTISDNGNSTEIEPGSVTTGFNLHLVPRIDHSGDLMLQYGINISELTGADDGFDTFTTNDSTVQLRRLNQRNFIQQARIPNGNTLVLAGFEQVRSSSDKHGVGHANFPLFGGKRASRIEREIVVIAITPTLLDLSKK